jgi:hypothetical protein
MTFELFACRASCAFRQRDTLPPSSTPFVFVFDSYADMQNVRNRRGV